MFLFQARRRTGTPEEFLKPVTAFRASIGSTNNNNNNTNEVPNKEDNNESKKKLEKSDSTDKVKLPEISEALMQRLLEIEMSRKQKGKDLSNDSKLMPPPPPPSTSGSSTSDSKRRSNSLTGSATSLNEAPGGTAASSLPSSFQRGNRVTKSARTFGSKMYKPTGGHGTRSQPSSASSSPTSSRKNSEAGNRGSQ